MILKGSQRAGAKQLATHLLKVHDNDHVEVNELRGFMAATLTEAFQEAYAVSRGTRCKQFLFSLSLNPPEGAMVSDQAFRSALDKIETELGLTGQPRALVFHEKEGRRHAHAVWSRIDVDSMTAINLPHFKRKLTRLSRDLYLEHGWTMPAGLAQSQRRDPTNFTRDEWEQAKRAGKDARELKAAFQDCWAISDSTEAFAQALEERGLWLAKGDRRGYVAVDVQGEIYAVAKWTGLKARDVRARLGEPERLPSVAEVKDRIAERMAPVIGRFMDDSRARHSEEAARLTEKKRALVARQRRERARLATVQRRRHLRETKERQARLPSGLKGVWFWLTGRYQKVRHQNEREALAALRRDKRQKHKLIKRQLRQRQALQVEIKHLRHGLTKDMTRLYRDQARIVRSKPDDSHRDLQRTDEQHVRRDGPARDNEDGQQNHRRPDDDRSRDQDDRGRDVDPSRGRHRQR